MAAVDRAGHPLEHGTGATYANWDRYHLVAWLLTALLSIVWLHELVIGLQPSWVRKRLGSRVAIAKS